MSSGFQVFQAKQTLQKMRGLEARVLNFAQHARTLRLIRTQAVDARDLLAEANSLLRSLMDAHEEFQKLEGDSTRTTRRLSNRPPKSPRPFQYEYHGPPPASQYGSEFRAASKRFMKALVTAENEVRQLMGAAMDDLNSPTRTGTEPSGVFDALMAFVEFLSAFVKSQQEKPG
jgi:hypothetical protein